MNRKLKFAAGITLYNPQLDNIEKANNYLNSFDLVIVFDNSDKDCSNVLKALSDSPHMIYVNGHGNQGLPKAYNHIIQMQEMYEVDYLCTLDQDSDFSSDNIEKLKAFISTHHSKWKEKVGIIAPFVFYGYNKPPVGVEYEKKKWTITSGSMLNLKLLNSKSIKYDENYFIDKFEIDLCMQTTLAGYSVLMYYGSILSQRLGEDSGHKHPNHSSLRHYYLFRNRFYFNKKFYKTPKRWYYNILQTSKHVALIILFEKNKTKKVSQLFIALKDYWLKKWGIRK